MKIKSVFLSFLFISLSILCYPQDTSFGSPKKKSNIWFGPKFGLDLNNFTYDLNDIKYQLKSNYQAGLMCQIGKRLYLQPEVYYASYESTNESDETVTTNYIKAPIMLGLRFLNLGLVSLHVMGGPSFKYNLATEKISDSFKNYSWQVGAGVDILGFITTDLRYTLQKGVSAAEQIEDFDLKETGLNFTVGLKLR